MVTHAGIFSRVNDSGSGIFVDWKLALDRSWEALYVASVSGNELQNPQVLRACLTETVMAGFAELLLRRS